MDCIGWPWTDPPARTGAGAAEAAETFSMRSAEEVTHAHTHTETERCPRKACGRVVAQPRRCRFLLIHFPDERHADRTATSCDEWQPKRGACVPSEEHHFTCWAPAVIQQHTHLLAVLAMLAEFSAVPSCGKSWVGARKRIPRKGSSSSDTWLLASAAQVNIPAGRRQRRHCHELQRKHARPRARLDRGAAGLVGRLVYLVPRAATILSDRDPLKDMKAACDTSNGSAKDYRVLPSRSFSVCIAVLISSAATPRS